MVLPELDMISEVREEVKEEVKQQNERQRDRSADDVLMRQADDKELEKFEFLSDKNLNINTVHTRDEAKDTDSESVKVSDDMDKNANKETTEPIENIKDEAVEEERVDISREQIEGKEHEADVENTKENEKISDIGDINRFEKIQELEKEYAHEQDKYSDGKVYVYKNDRKTIQQRIVEGRNEKEEYKQYREYLNQFQNAYTDKQRAYLQYKIDQYERRQMQKQEWERINKQHYEAKSLNRYDMHIWDAAQLNKGILTEKAIKQYAEKTFSDAVKRDRFINYAESQLMQYERLGMLNDKSQTMSQRIDIFGLVTKKTHTAFESRTVFYNDERIDRRIKEIEDFVREKGFADKLKFNLSSASAQEIWEEKNRILLTLKEEKSAGREYKDLYKGFLTSKDKDLNSMTDKQVQAEYEALRKIKMESAREYKIRKNYRFEVNYRFYNKVKEYEQRTIDKERDVVRFSPLAVFDKDISEYMDRNYGILDDGIFARIIQKEGNTPETSRKIQLVKTRIQDLRYYACLVELKAENLGNFRYKASAKYDLKQHYKSFGNSIDRQIHEYCEKNEKTVKFDALESYIRESNKELSEDELEKKIAVIEHRIRQLHANGYFHKIADGVYVSKENFDDAMKLIEAYVRFKEGEDISVKDLELTKEIKEIKKINSFGCKLDKDIFQEALANNGVFDIEKYTAELDDRRTKMTEGRVYKLEKFGYLEKDSEGRYIITEQFKTDLKAKQLREEQELKDKNFERFQFKLVDHNNYLKTLRAYIDKQGYFNEEEYKLEKYGDKNIKADDMRFNDKCMIKRFQTMLNAGVLTKDEKGNLTITERGLQAEKEFLEGTAKTNTKENKKIIKEEIKFTSFDYTNIAVAVDDNGIFSKENFIRHFSKNDFVGAKGQSYRWTPEQVESKYKTAVKRIETHIKLDNLSVTKLPDGSYKLDKNFIDRAIIEFEKHKLQGKERTVLLNKEQHTTVADVGSFGQLTERQIVELIYNGREDLYRIDLDDLKRKGLVEVEKVNLKHIGEQNLIVLTPKGRAVAEMNTGKSRIATKDKLNKEGELAHDIFVYDVVKHLERQLKAEGKEVEITYSDRQLKSHQQSILAREYDNIGLGLAAKNILEAAAENRPISKEIYTKEMQKTFTKEGFINKKIASFNKTFEAMRDKGFLCETDGKYKLTGKGQSLLDDINKGRLQVMFADCQMIVRDIETGERSVINVEVDLGYSPDEIKEKIMHVPNQIWATNSQKQQRVITKLGAKTVFLIR
jgi:ribosomal protein S19E (S16A)